MGIRTKLHPMGGKLENKKWEVTKVGTRQEGSTSVTGYDFGFHCVSFGYPSGIPTFIGSGSEYIYNGLSTENHSFVAKSTDGLNWTYWDKDSSGSFIFNSTEFKDAIWVNNKFYSVSKRGNDINTSTNCQYWTRAAYTTITYQSIAYGNNVFILSDGNKKYGYSYDGTNWTDVSLNSFAGGKIRYLNNLFITSGNSTGYITSFDGVLFRLHQPASSYSWNSLTYGNGKYLFVGNNGYVTTSTDLDNWTTPLKITEADIYDVTFAEGQFCAVGYKTEYVNSNYKYTGFIATSKDGINWTAKESDSYRWESVTCGEDYFVAVGTNYNYKWVQAYNTYYLFIEGVIARRLI